MRIVVNGYIYGRLSRKTFQSWDLANRYLVWCERLGYGVTMGTSK